MLSSTGQSRRVLSAARKEDTGRKATMPTFHRFFLVVTACTLFSSQSVLGFQSASPFFTQKASLRRSGLSVVARRQVFGSGIRHSKAQIEVAAAIAPVLQVRVCVRGGGDRRWWWACVSFLDTLQAHFTLNNPEKRLFLVRCSTRSAYSC